MSEEEAQAIYEMMLLDDRMRCTCDESYREATYFQASGHYHHCMLYQVTRAIRLSLKYRDGFRLVNGKLIDSLHSKNLVRHHPDYSKPKLTVTLCDSCHKKLHQGEKRDG